MKVYVTFYKDGFGEQSVDKVFSSSEKACKYVIERDFRNNGYYKDFSEDALMKAAAVYVEVVDVE